MAKSDQFLKDELLHLDSHLRKGIFTYPETNFFPTLSTLTSFSLEDLDGGIRLLDLLLRIGISRPFPISRSNDVCIVPLFGDYRLFPSWGSVSETLGPGVPESDGGCPSSRLDGCPFSQSRLCLVPRRAQVYGVRWVSLVAPGDTTHPERSMTI